MPDRRTLEESLGYRFQHPETLETALTHRSFLNERTFERSHLPSNERLEFLGDAILNYLAALLVYEEFSHLGEGDLTRLRAELIRAGTLAEMARDLGLGEYIRMGRGEHASGARTRDSLLSDTFEAVLAAIFTDGGIDAARTFLIPRLLERVHSFRQDGLPIDYKTRLQHYVQSHHNTTPHYRVKATDGPVAQPIYTIEVLINGEPAGEGHGASKQAASQQAACQALERLGVVCANES